MGAIVQMKGEGALHAAKETDHCMGQERDGKSKAEGCVLLPVYNDLVPQYIMQAQVHSNSRTACTRIVGLLATDSYEPPQGKLLIDVYAICYSKR